MNVMRHKFTLRETILLILLFVILAVGLYFFLIFYPIQNRISEIETQREEVAFDNEIADARLIVYNRMQAEIAEIEKIPEDQRTRMYKYTPEEKENILSLMYTVFGDNVQSLSYKENPNGKILEFVINFTFRLEEVTKVLTDPETAATAPYEQGKQILHALANTGRRSQISNLSISAANGDIATGGLTVSGTITFYELA